MTAVAESAEPPPVFEAVIVPHRSLSPGGLRLLTVVLFGLSAAVSAGLWLAGAWPVIGFSGLEVGLAVWLIGRNARTQASEILILSAAGLRVIRTDRRGRRWEKRLSPAWLRATVQERPGRTPSLVVGDRGGRLEIAADLGEAEKRDLAAALREALYRQRHPVFDNPQLRE